MFLRNQTFAVDFPTCLDNEEVTLKSFQEKSDFLLRLSSIDHLTIAWPCDKILVPVQLEISSKSSVDPSKIDLNESTMSRLTQTSSFQRLKLLCPGISAKKTLTELKTDP